MPQGIMLNIDDSHYWDSRWRAGIHPEEEDLRRFVRQYRQTQVTDLLLCVGGRISCCPSRTRMSHLDKYRQRLENGQPVDYTDTLLSLVHEVYDVKQLDPYAIWIDEARRCGLTVWLSVRMNDCHDCLLPTSRLHSDFYHAHPEYRRIRHRAPDGYFDYCFDYGEEPVRRHMLDYLQEVLARYAPDGLELDWQREASCFQPGHESAACITEFMREARRLTRLAEGAAGLRILTGVRVPADPQDALELGFDVAAWAQEGLVDSVTPTARWATTDNDMPLGLWKRLLRGTSAQLAPGVELLIRSYPQAPVLYTSREHVTAAAAQYYSLGADKVYLYNYFDDPGVDGHSYWRGAEDQPRMSVRPENLSSLLNVLGDADAVKRQPRCHMLTYRDFVPAWRGRHARLPLRCAAGDPCQALRIVTGDVPPGMSATLRLGLLGTPEAEARVFVNSAPVQCSGIETCLPAYTQAPLRLYPIEGYAAQSAVVEILAERGELTVDYADVTLLPQK